MNHQQSTGIFSESLRTLIKSAFKLTVITFAWLMKACGLVLGKIGETIERIIIKKSQ